VTSGATSINPDFRKRNSDASAEALSVARRTLADHDNIRFFHATAKATPLPRASQDFGYSLGVLHQIPDTEAALKACVDLLKPGTVRAAVLQARKFEAIMKRTRPVDVAFL